MPSGVKIGTAFIDVHADTTNAFKGIDKNADSAGTMAGGRFKGAFTKGLAGMGAVIAGAFAVDKIGDFLTGAVTGASDLNEETSKSDVIFGKASGSIFKWAKGAATSVGLSETAALKATGTFGNMFTQLGFGQGKAAGMSKDVVQLSADLGSFNNLPTAEVADMMGAAFRGEYDSIQRLLPGINAASVEQEALAQTGKTSAASLTAQEKAAAVLSLAHKGGAKASGDFAKTQGGMAGQLKIAGAEFENMSTGIGLILLPMITGLMSFVNTNVIPGMKKLGDFIKTEVAPAFGRIGAFIQNNVMPHLQNFGNFIRDEIVPKLQILGDHITNKVMPVLGAFGDFINTEVIPKLSDIGNFIRDEVIPKLSAFSQWFEDNLPIIADVIGAILIPAFVRMAIGATVNAALVVIAWATTVASAIAAGVVYVVQSIVIIARWVAMGVAAVINAAVVVGAWVVMATQATINAIKMAAAWLIAMGPIGLVIAAVVGLVAIIILNWDKIVDFTRQAFTNISNFLSTVWNNIVNFLRSAWSNIVNFVSSGVNNARNIITSVFGAIASFVSSIFNNIVNFISRAFSSAVSFVSNGVNNIKNFISNGFNAAVGLARTAFNNVATAVSNGISNAVNFVSGLPGKVLSALGNLGSTLYNSGRSLIEGFINGIKDMAGNIGNAVGSILEGARRMFPFSPAKEGPFSGKGYTTYSGKALAGDFANSIKAQSGAVKAAASSLMSTASNQLSGGLSVNSQMADSTVTGLSSGSTVNNNVFNVTISASEVDDFQKVVSVFNSLAQAARTGSGTQLRRA